MNCKTQKVYKGMKIGYIFIILLLLVACKPYDDYKERGHWKQLKENERIGFYWRHNDKIYAALGDSAVLIKYVKPMEDVDIATFYVNKETTNGMENYAKDKKNVYYPLHAICVDADTYGYEYATEPIVKGAFPSSFRYVGDGKGTDGYTMYRYGWRVDK
jgi:putative lipoprotein